MNRTQWQVFAEENIRGGYVAGSNKSKFYEFGLDLLHRIEREATPLQGNDILDLGCGNGRLPAVLDGEDVNIKSYTGIDVNPDCVQFLNKAFKNLPNYQAIHANVHNGHYAAGQRAKLANYKIPGKIYDVVIANSLFTHLGNPDNVKHYLTEVYRVLADDGVFYSTWFRNPPHPVNHGEAMSVYDEMDILDWMESVGFHVNQAFGGRKRKRRDHWRITAIKNG